MRTIEIHIPDEVDLKDGDFSMIIASKLYEDGKLTAGQVSTTPEVAQEFSEELPESIIDELLRKNNEMV